jgi:hypothetical protein
VRLAVTLAAGVLLVCVLPATSSARDITQTASAGGVRATLTYRVTKDVYSQVRLRVVRAGHGLVDDRLREVTCGGGCATWAPGFGAHAGPVRVRDLDADGEPEVLLDLYSGGAHCCALTAFYRYDANSTTYRRSVWDFHDSGYRLVDLDADGRPEMASYDDRFAYVFAPFAFSLAPRQIWQWQAGDVLDVSRDFSDPVRTDARRAIAIYERSRAKGDRMGIRGALAAWMADQYLLGRGPQSWQRLEAANKAGELGKGPKELGYPAGRQYIDSLRSFLRKTGYIS